MSHVPNDPFAARARALFERAADGVDNATSARLRAMRRTATRPKAGRTRTGWPTLAPMAAALAVALGLAWWVSSPTDDRDAPVLAIDDARPTPSPPPAIAPPSTPVDPGSDEIARLLDSEDPDLYAWLADAPVATAVASP